MRFQADILGARAGGTTSREKHTKKYDFRPEAVKNAKSGQMRYRTDKNGIIHGGVGQVGFDPEAIKQNVEALLADLKKIKPASAKGIYVKKVTLSTTMGAGIAIDQASLEA